jgi:peptide/nickel transport system substrate-binding protein
MFVLGILIITSMVLSACQPQGTVTTVEVVKTQEVIVEKTVEVVTTQEVIVEKTVEVMVTPPPVDRKGGWLDTVTMIADPSVQSAVTRIIAGDIDVYAQSSSNAETFKTATDAGLQTINSYGSYNDLTFNTYGPVFEESTGGLNPFAVREVREAMNRLLDRNYIVQEIMGGLAVPKFFPLTAGFPDYAKYIDVARELEAKYAYDFDAANAVITGVMEDLGAVLVDGKWTFNDEPVTIILLIRVEDERRQIGDYVANQLEAAGFATDRQYKTSSEASVLWVRGNVADGLWHLYTGGWITTAIDRDQGSNFEFFFSPRSAYSFTTLWQSYELTDEQVELFTTLANNDFTNLDERKELFSQAMRDGIETSNRLWLVDRLSYSPLAANVEVGADLAGGISGSSIGAHTLRFSGEEGGDLTYAMADLLVEPINGVAGSNWIYDTVPMTRFADSPGVVTDPFTGLALPNRIEKAEVTIQEGLPVGVTLDWVTLEFAPEIAVPEDAWSDWDVEGQKWITAGEKFPEGATAKVKSVAYYPADFFSTVTWHDGSPISVADFVMALIVPFDVAKEGSAIYDESQAGNLESFLSAFKGYRIASTDPLVVEFYSDNYALDAENNVTTFWPNYGYGTQPWQAVAIGYMADAAGELAFSADKAEAAEVEWMSYISGPSLEILRAKLTEAKDSGYIPYPNVMGEFLTADEVASRYSNFERWYIRQGHFWVGVGPYYLNKVFPVEKTLSMTRYQEYPDSASKWARFSEARIADAEVDGPGRVDIGAEATFDVFVTFKGEAYAQADIAEVKYLLFDANGALAASGAAEAVADGQYSVTLSADVTSKLAAGSNKIEIAILSKLVSLPAFATFEFVTQ